MLVWNSPANVKVENTNPAIAKLSLEISNHVHDPGDLDYDERTLSQYRLYRRNLSRASRTSGPSQR